MRVCLFGTYDTAAHPRVAVLRDGLVAGGAEVVECNAPLGLDTAARVDMLRRPWKVLGLLGRLASRWWRLARLSRRLPRPDAVLVGYLGHFDVHLARLLFPGVPVALDHLVGAADTARDRGAGGGLRGRLLGTLDRAALGAAEVVVVDTDEQRDELPAGPRERAVVVPVGATQPWFEAGRAAAAKRPRGGPLRVVFFGLFTPLQGAPVIADALSRLADDPSVVATMVGSGQDLAAARRLAARNPRVSWLAWVPADDLPALVAAHDVCLGIFGTGAKAARVVPTKVYQGAAAGCALVTSDTPPQRRVLDGAATLVPPGDGDALAEALQALAADRARLAQARTAATAAAAGFAPRAAVAPLLHRLTGLVDQETTA